MAKKISKDFKLNMSVRSTIYGGHPSDYWELIPIPSKLPQARMIPDAPMPPIPANKERGNTRARLKNVPECGNMSEGFAAVNAGNKRKKITLTPDPGKAVPKEKHVPVRSSAINRRLSRYGRTGNCHSITPKIAQIRDEKEHYNPHAGLSTPLKEAIVSNSVVEWKEYVSYSVIGTRTGNILFHGDEAGYKQWQIRNMLSPALFRVKKKVIRKKKKSKL